MSDSNFQLHSPALAPPAASEPIVSYAQNGEDVMLQRALRHVDRGRYIDVGAAEPEVDSVTCAFYRRGWRGINVEPAPGSFGRLFIARPEDINLNLAVTDQSGVTSFFLIDDGNSLSTAVPIQAERLREQGLHCTEIEVATRTLASIVAEYVRWPVHFLKIDAEGSELRVLASVDLYKFRPWIILVEATFPNSQVPTYQDWEDLLLQANYRFVWFDGLNCFYLALEHLELIELFRAPPNVFDNFVRRAEADALAQLVKARSDFTGAILREQRTNAALQIARDELARSNACVEKLRAEVGRLKQERDSLMQEVSELRLRTSVAAGSSACNTSRTTTAPVGAQQSSSAAAKGA